MTCVNTLVEAPPVIEHVHGFIDVLKAYVSRPGAPGRSRGVDPGCGPNLLGQPHWSRLSRSGAPVPMVHRPHEGPAVTKFLESREDVFGSPPVAHFLLGTRFDESAARKGTMEANSDLGTDIHQHGTIPTSGVIRPIETWSTDDVWDHLLKPDWVGGGQNPFFTVNQKLATLYRDAASGECPVIHDPSRQTCAGSRFGC